MRDGPVDSLTVPDPRRWQVLALLGTAFFIVILDGTIVYVAIPSIGQSLNFSASGVQWVLTSYMLAFGGLLLLGGRVADLIGRRRVFMTGVATFTTSSLVCGLAPSAEALVGARAAQGIGAAVMAPTALSLLLTAFSEGPERNKALAIWGGIGGVGGTAGLLLGGPVTDVLGWQWIFLINVPVGIVLLLLSRLLLTESSNSGLPRNFDVAGALTITLALVLIVYGISEAPTFGWMSLRSLLVFVGSAVLIGLFLTIQRRSAAPLVPLRIFRSRSLVGGSIVLLTAGMSVDGVLLVCTLYAQNVLGASAIQFGLLTAAMTVMSVIGVTAGQAFSARGSIGCVASSGSLLMLVGCLLLSRISVDGGLGRNLLLGLLIFGAGLGSAFVGAQIAAFAGISDDESGLAAGIIDTCFTIGGALGLAVVSTVAASRATELAHGGAVDPIVQNQGLQAALLVAAGFAVVGLLASLGLLNQRRSAADSTAIGNL